MSTRPSLARLIGFYRQAEGQPSPPAPSEDRHVTVALSREAGAHGPEVAQVVGTRLGWPVYDHDLVTRIARAKGLHERLLQEHDERHVSWLEEMIHNLGTVEGGREEAYLKFLLEQLNVLGKTGHCVIVGRGAPHVLPPETTLRVRVVAPRKYRVDTVASELDMPREEAGRWVDSTDQERLQFVRSYFHKDAGDPLGYDLVLNAARYSVDECADIIAEAARRLEARLSPKAAPAAAG